MQNVGLIEAVLLRYHMKEKRILIPLKKTLILVSIFFLRKGYFLKKMKKLQPPPPIFENDEGRPNNLGQTNQGPLRFFKCPKITFYIEKTHLMLRNGKLIECVILVGHHMPLQLKKCGHAHQVGKLVPLELFPTCAIIVL